VSGPDRRFDEPTIPASPAFGDDDDAVTYDRDGALGVVRMNRPDNRNGMTGELLDGFAAAIAEARADKAARCVIVTGSGNAFSAGADLKDALQRGAPDADPEARSYAMYVPFLSVLELEVPVIAAMNGHAIGGGFGLALACDVRVAARQGRYGANFCRLGLSPGMAISALLPRLIGPARAAELLLGGELVDGERAVALGIASEAVDAAEVLPRARAIAGRIAANAPLAVRFTKALLREALGDVLAHARKEAFFQARTVASRDAAEGVAALLEKRDPKFRGD
jgi:enoyl-CoA hydratase/carnithine racemase